MSFITLGPETEIAPPSITKGPLAPEGGLPLTVPPAGKPKQQKPRREQAMLGLEEAISMAQQHMSEKHAKVTADLSKTEVFISFIDKFLSDNKIKVEGLSKGELINRIYSEMREESVLTPFLRRKDVEEINVNSWDDIKITYSDGRTERLGEKFFSPAHASDVISRILQKSNMIFDESKPFAVGHLDTNKRVTAMGYGIIDRDKGVAMSIRIVNPKEFAKADFIRLGTATEDMMDFLLNAFKHNVSMCIAGATSSGKTTLLSLLQKEIPDTKRLVTIEGGTREFDCVRRDIKGQVTNNVIHLITKESEKDKQSVTQNKLLQLSLTINPDFLTVAEMKGEESFEAVSAANTGHSVITTIHANSCREAYPRMVVLCKQAYMMDDKTLFSLAASSFPIVAYCKKLNDNSRRVMEITECEGLKDGLPVIRTLYRFRVDKNTIDETGNPQVVGHFEKVNNPSDQMLRSFKENGMPDSIYDKLFGGGR
ncbi:MAG: CpaF/VirB11 family protein [Lachnospiraceae bacterium]|nr:CpaF/VirB11 family protein [Lachnospiraceae bacterium]